MSKKIVVLGADGYYGRPLVKRLSQHHDVKGVDNFWRRNDSDHPSLTPLGNPDQIEYCDVTDYDQLYGVLNVFQPDIVVHLAEQRSAPFSMKDIKSKHFTIHNNTISSINVMEAARALGFHTIHIGSMGVYGYDQSGVISEGDRVRRPGSVYHLSKCLDNSIFEFYSRIYNNDITELHQGVIWGIGGRFDYDHVFGTVVNRFLVQNMINRPLSLYGSGLQQRAFINIENSLDCIELVIKHSTPGQGMRTMNQYTEIFELKQIADMVSTDQTLVDNPRIEPNRNKLNSTNETLASMGLETIHMTPYALTQIQKQLEFHIDGVDVDLIDPTIRW